MIRSAKIGILLVLIFALSSCAPAKEKVEDIIAANKALDEKYVDAFVRNNPDSLMSLYLKSPGTFQITAEGNITNGYEAIKAYYQDFFSNFEVKDVKILEHDYKVYEGVVVGYGRYWVKFQSKGGPEQEFTARYLDVRERHDGKWYYVSNIEVAVQPSPDAAKEKS